MVDVEADGPIPGDYSMVCFGAIVVEPALDRTFYERLKLDLDWLEIHGEEGVECSWPCRYFGDGLTADGMWPTDFWRREEEKSPP